MKTRQLLAAALAAGFVATSASAANFSENFETDASGDFVVVGGADGSLDFNFDYVAAGIALAPNSTAGDTNGVRLTANDTTADGDFAGDGAPATDATTLFHTNGQTGSYTLYVDVYWNIGGTSGSTEYAHVGIGGDSATANVVFTPISGSGHFIAFTGDGGSSTSDYRHFEPGTTTAPNSDPSYLGNGSNNTGSHFTSLFPGGIAGAPDNQWTTVRIDVDSVNNTVSYYFDDTLTFQSTVAPGDGAVSIGIADVFSSVDPGNIFVVYDNLVVTDLVPEPGSLALLGLGGLAMLRRRR